MSSKGESTLLHGLRSDRETLSSMHLHDPAIQPVLSRRYVEWLTVITFAFIVQGSFVPWDFTPAVWNTEPTRLFRSVLANPSMPDLVGNIFLYFPLGLFIQATARRSGMRGWSAFVVALVAASACSVLIEAAQSMSPSRISSLIDVVCNTIGAALGGFVAWVGRPFLRSMRQRVFEGFGKAPHGTTAWVYAFVLCTCELIPFSFALDAGNASFAAKAAYWTPFESLNDARLREEKAWIESQRREYPAARWEQLRLAGRWAAETAAFAALAMLVVRSLRLESEFTRAGAMTLALWVSLLLGVLLSFAQFFVATRGFDATDLIFRGVGALCGSAVAFVARPARTVVNPPLTLDRRTWSFAALAVLAYITYCGLIPAVFDPSRQAVVTALSSPAVWPFFGYFETRYDRVLDDVLHKLAMYALFGAALRMSVFAPRGDLSSHQSYAFGWKAPVLAALLVATMVEVVQLVEPIRVVSLTDLLLAAVGSAFGASAIVQWAAFQQHAQHAQHASTHRPMRTPARPSATPRTADELIATLADPRPDAPKEPQPAPTPQSQPLSK